MSSLSALRYEIKTIIFRFPFGDFTVISQPFYFFIFRFFGLCYAMDGVYNKCNPYIERHLAIFVNCFRSRTN
ncbi:hypothetical protein ED562_18265 [Microcystis aeruginosa FACHB-524]|nr:hypothetical protein ED562_18265 [Microcystis aeruginosa FACHB-524]